MYVKRNSYINIFEGDPSWSWWYGCLIYN